MGKRSLLRQSACGAAIFFARRLIFRFCPLAFEFLLAGRNPRKRIGAGPDSWTHFQFH